jgi:hypothetical protein
VELLAVCVGENPTFLISHIHPEKTNGRCVKTMTVLINFKYFK